MRDGNPIPSPSKAPELVTETEDTRNPRQIIRRAEEPIFMVAGVVVNRWIRVPGMHKHRTVPIAMIARTRIKEV